MVKPDHHNDEIIPPEEIALFLAMRKRAKAGARIHLRYDRRADELIATEEVLHRASDFKECDVS